MTLTVQTCTSDDLMIADTQYNIQDSRRRPAGLHEQSTSSEHSHVRFSRLHFSCREIVDPSPAPVKKFNEFCESERLGHAAALRDPTQPEAAP